MTDTDLSRAFLKLPRRKSFLHVTLITVLNTVFEQNALKKVHSSGHFFTTRYLVRKVCEKNMFDLWGLDFEVSPKGNVLEYVESMRSENKAMLKNKA